MKTLATLIFLSISIVLSSCGEHIKGNGRIEERQQDLDHFNSIHLSGIFEVQLIEGDEQIEVITDENLHEHIHIALEDNDLVIDTKDKYLSAEKILLRIHYSELEAIDVSGAVSLASEGQFNSNHVSLDVSGACEGSLDVDVDDLDVEISGGGELTLAGNADFVRIRVSGAGEINALDLHVMEADFDITGAGEIEMTVENKLDVEVTGAGEVRYAGNPALSKKVTGAGEITQIC